MTALRVRDLHLRRTDRAVRTDVLTAVSFDVAPGARIALVGASGAGKTSLLRTIAGLDQPSGGTIGLAEPGSGDDVRVGMAFQQPAMLPWATVLENVCLPIRLQRKVRPADRARAEELLQGFEISPRYWPARPVTLSGGMRQRVALAAALIELPSILVLDEPLSSVDELTRFRCLQALESILDSSGTTSLLATHSIAEAALFADSVLVLGGTPSTLIDRIDVAAARPRSPGQLAGEAMTQVTARILGALGVG